MKLFSKKTNFRKEMEELELRTKSIREREDRLLKAWDDLTFERMKSTDDAKIAKLSEAIERVKDEKRFFDTAYRSDVEKIDKIAHVLLTNTARHQHWLDNIRKICTIGFTVIMTIGLYRFFDYLGLLPW